MDGIDYKVLRILKENARESASNIGKSVHLSVSAVLDRIHKLEESGVIRSYTIILDEKRMGNETLALMEVSLEHPKYYDAFTAAILKNDNVVDCYLVTGEYDFQLKVSCKSSEELETVHRFIMSIQGVSNTKTHVILRTVKNAYSIVPESK